MTGWRRMSDGTSVHSPMPKPSAHIQELMSSGVALNACAAWNTMATELVKPTSTATNPAVKADRLKSLKNRMAPILHGARHRRRARPQPSRAAIRPSVLSASSTLCEYGQPQPSRR